MRTTFGLAFALSLASSGCDGPAAFVGDAGPAVVPMSHCVTFETWTCSRECSTGRYTMAMCDSLCDTAATVEARCAGFAFPGGCFVSQLASDRCITAMRDTALISTPSSELSECRTENLCGH